jgi:hypothetical protein
LYRTMKYFLDRANAAHAAMQDPQKVYSTWMTEYLNKKTEGCSCSQSLLTTSTSWSWRGSAVEVSDKLPVQITKSKWWNNNTKNSYWEPDMLMLLQKPLLLHYPYSHVITACLATKNNHWGHYVPKYFLKQMILDTWNHTIEGYLHLGTFTQDPKDSALYISNPDPTMCQGVSRQRKKRIRNDMVEAEAGPQVQICSKWNNPGHSYKKCTEAPYFSTSTSTPPSASAGGRRSSRYNEGMQ